MTQNKTFNQIEELKILGFEKQGKDSFVHSDLQIRVNVLELFGEPDEEGKVYKLEMLKLIKGTLKHKKVTKYIDNDYMENFIIKLKEIIENLKNFKKEEYGMEN